MQMDEYKLAVLVCNNHDNMNNLLNKLITQTSTKEVKEKSYTHGYSYQYYKSNGICHVCHVAKVEKGKSRCSACLEKSRIYQNKKRRIKKIG
jgi:uncharacterized paraquat-inducible protein A